MVDRSELIKSLDCLLEELDDNFDYIGDYESIERWINNDAAFVEFLAVETDKLPIYSVLKVDFSFSLEKERASRNQDAEAIHEALVRFRSFFDTIKASLEN